MPYIWMQANRQFRAFTRKQIPDTRGQVSTFFCIRGGTLLAVLCSKSKPKGLIRANHAKAWDAKPLT